MSKEELKVGDKVQLVGYDNPPIKTIKQIHTGSGAPTVELEDGSFYWLADLKKVKPDFRPKFESIFIKLAFSLAERSTCDRKTVGCIVTSEDYTEIFGIGYNGNHRGGPNNCDNPDVSGGCGCLHAEDNCLLKVSKPKEIPKIMFITTMPCKTCAKRIINKGGIKQVYYVHKHRCEEGIEILKTANIKVNQMLLNGDKYEWEIQP